MNAKTQLFEWSAAVENMSRRVASWRSNGTPPTPDALECLATELGYAAAHVRSLARRPERRQ